MSPCRGAIARDGYGQIGVITCVMPLRVDDGAEPFDVWTGVMLWPLHRMGQRWQSRAPEVLYQLADRPPEPPRYLLTQSV